MGWQRVVCRLTCSFPARAVLAVETSQHGLGPRRAVVRDLAAILESGNPEQIAADLLP